MAKISKISGVAALCALFGSAAWAAPLTWDLEIVFAPSFDAFVGNLTYDADSSTLVDASFQFADGGFFPISASWTEADETFASVTGSGALAQIVFTNADNDILDLSFSAPLGNGGGTSDVTLVYTYPGGTQENLSTTISAPMTPTTPVPLPAGLPLSLAALAGLAVMRARR